MHLYGALMHGFFFFAVSQLFSVSHCDLLLPCYLYILPMVIGKFHQKRYEYFKLKEKLNSIQDLYLYVWFGFGPRTNYTRYKTHSKLPVSFYAHGTVSLGGTYLKLWYRCMFCRSRDFFFCIL